MALKRGIVKIEKYNSNWVNEYREEAKLLKFVLKDKIIEIHHVGSTSIIGLSAKPIIDILVVINSLDEIPEIEKILKKYDYHNRGFRGVKDRYLFVKGSEDARTHYVHFTEPESDTYYDQIYFKRYLEEHPKILEEYSKLKYELAKKYADDRYTYTSMKNGFINNVISLAKEKYND